MAAALTPNQQRSLLRSLGKLQQTALEARSAPIPRGSDPPSTTSPSGLISGCAARSTRLELTAQSGAIGPSALQAHAAIVPRATADQRGDDADDSVTATRPLKMRRLPPHGEGVSRVQRSDSVGLNLDFGPPILRRRMRRRRTGQSQAIRRANVRRARPSTNKWPASSSFSP